MTGEYAIYHQAYANDPCPLQVATLEATSLEDAWEKSQNKGNENIWLQQPYVIEILTTEYLLRSTDIGDIISDPEGKAFIVQGSGFTRCEEYDSELLS